MLVASPSGERCDGGQSDASPSGAMGRRAGQGFLLVQRTGRDVSARFAAAVNERRIAGLPNDVRSLTSTLHACRQRHGFSGSAWWLLNRVTVHAEQMLTRITPMIVRGSCSNSPCPSTSALRTDGRFRRFGHLSSRQHAVGRVLTPSSYASRWRCRGARLRSQRLVGCSRCGTTGASVASVCA
jgi:hypothetical protein